MKSIIFRKSGSRFNRLGSGLIILSILGCAGASKAPTTPENNSASAKRTESSTSASMAPSGDICEVHYNDDRTNVVISKQNDWIVPVVKGGQVECDDESGIAKVAMSGIHINLTVSELSPYICFEQALQLLLEGYVRGVSESVAFEQPLAFEERNVGEHGRRALISDGRFKQGDQYMHLLTAVTGVVNTHNQAVFHVVFWKLSESELRKNEHLAHETLFTISAAWFRLSDVDKKGEIANVW